MASFAKPLRKRSDEPPGLDEFAAGAPRPFPRPVELADPDDAQELARPSTGRVERDDEPERYGMNIRFTATEKAALVKLAKSDARSQHQIVKRLLGPVLAAAAAAYEARELTSPA